MASGDMNSPRGGVPARLDPRALAVPAAVSALSVVVLVAAWMGLSASAGFLTIAATAIVFAALAAGFLAWRFSRRLPAWRRIILSALAAAAIGHLVLWLPFLFGAYVSGLGLRHAFYSALAALGTALPVSWYAAERWWYVTLPLALALVAWIAWRARRRAGGR